MSKKSQTPAGTSTVEVPPAPAQDTPASEPKSKKPVCPLSREEFIQKAKPLSVILNGVPMVAGVKEFSTGSFGWYLNGKTTIDVDGKAVEVQLGFNITAIGSKS